ncbi:hypothetical protein SO802_022024 [Lithocarpus litseifolius]|uniref:Uncharacterized protein n=1 Tax=Lithocarpus litseifolius TaxID=425828 RepID=A0AAW2CIK3_9ROSI
MPQFSRTTFSFLLIIIVVISIPTVRFEYGSSIIRLSSKDTTIAADLCANSKNRPIPEPISCSVKCFWAVPVCGVDGMTYWCGCADALCTSVKVARLGFCEIGGLLGSLCFSDFSDS